jgi:hypothetical protein
MKKEKQLFFDQISIEHVTFLKLIKKILHKDLFSSFNTWFSLLKTFKLASRSDVLSSYR